jgi:uncharacterized short protein YbdD (DUF466 family)
MQFHSAIAHFTSPRPAGYDRFSWRPLVGQALLRAFWYLRQVSGDAAYENYLRRASAARIGGHLLSREEFYLDALRRRYTGPSRCC